MRRLLLALALLLPVAAGAQEASVFPPDQVGISTTTTFGTGITFEGATVDGVQTTLTVTDPTAPDKTITLPDLTGTVLLGGATNTVTGATTFLLDSPWTVYGVNGDINTVFQVDPSSGVASMFTGDLSYQTSVAVALGSIVIDAVGFGIPGYITMGGRVAYSPQTFNIADSGDGAAGAGNLEPVSAVVFLNCQDADGCDITMVETSATSGQMVTIVNTSANVCNFTDTPGVSEIAGDFAMGQYDTLNLTYIGTTYVEISRVTGTVSHTVDTGTLAFDPGSTNTDTCAAAITDTATGTLTTDVISWTFSADPTSTTGYDPSGDLGYIVAYPTADTVSFKFCNKSGSAIDPGSVTLNWRVDR